MWLHIPAKNHNFLQLLGIAEEKVQACMEFRNCAGIVECLLDELLMETTG